MPPTELAHAPPGEGFDEPGRPTPAGRHGLRDRSRVGEARVNVGESHRLPEPFGRWRIDEAGRFGKESADDPDRIDG